MPFPLPSTHSGSIAQSCSIFMTHDPLHLRPGGDPPFSPGPFLLFETQLSSLEKLALPLLCLTQGDTVVSNTNMVSGLWTLPFSSSSLHFYRICPFWIPIHFEYLIVYGLQSCLKLYVLCICLNVLWEIIKIGKSPRYRIYTFVRGYHYFVMLSLFTVLFRDLFRKD